ncbi:BTAD domain-containing putative transcriptional regulator [Amycolatopsis thermoflava]|uniref:ATP/maltotriose-dependent transcriptional regulator MalT n=1 Tax=Amycolatopsis thermoflava TaxID=84480 RepID=A0A3N2H5X0_9PSEU|nr:BTAD domain-containing putative transcriptional regulator [Amycolatopsis thermoflava]ROS44312.1 ATP/maltotriose-dependent transcriptional regulator MalT [Amycolatopsis thermoflava]
MPPSDAGVPSDSAARTIIRRKLAQPVVGDRLVRRDRLVDRIRGLLGRANVLTVYAAAGSGKTTAVAMALQDLDRPVAWLSLDGTESAAGRLLLYIEAAVAPHASEARGAATDALAAGILIGEAAGLLAESLHGTGTVLVCDNAERISGSDEALTVLSALARYAPADVAIILISRTALPLDTGSTGELARVAELTGPDLAFALDETEEALRLAGRPVSDAAEVMRVTGGWAAGILFADGAAADAPHRFRDYLSTHVLSGLSEAERQFLVHTSLLDEVTADDAVALGLDDAPRVLAALRRRHLPATWPDDRTLMVSPQLRDHLRDLLAQQEPGRLKQLRLRHARLLVRRGEQEEAVDALLDVGAVDEAWVLAAELLPRLIERMDFGPAARWLDELQVSQRSLSPRIGGIVLRVAFALEQAGRGVELYDRHGRDWITELAADERDGSGEALVLLVWCLWHAGRSADAELVCELLPRGRARDIALTVLALSRDEPPPPFPPFATTPSGPLDGMLMRLAFMRGRLAGLDDPGAYGPWRSVLGAPWVIAGLRATGRIEKALALYEAHRDAPQPLWLHALDAVELMIDLGRAEEAWQALRRGHELVSATGSQIYRVLLHLMEAKLCLRLHHDPEAAHRALDEAEASGAGTHAFTRELASLWRGLAFLLRHRDTEARDVLQPCLQSMLAADRVLEIPTAACYLAEVLWRLGAEDASDESASLAIRVAEERGSVHLLLNALSDVPAVAVRGADTESNRLSRWHELTASLANGRRITAAGRAPRLVLEDLGEPELRVDGATVTPRLRKSIELLAYLLATPGHEAGRQELLGSLFDSDNEAAGRSYLRQALYRLREVLPEELSPVLRKDRFCLPGPDLVASSATEVLEAFTRADHQDGEVRLNTLTEALAATERGRYLAGLSGAWVETRRAEVDERILRARLDVAKVAFRLGRYRDAVANVDTVLRLDPYREQGWLLRITLARASGNDDDVLALYQRYVATMHELAVPPSAEVHRLVTRLRS